ncbi:MAG TPA: hypothetical protein VKM56_04130 [Verrucomicrobiae bacterium]|nr:hypothetical protein [Verrucomicrobiae bacterium]
MKCFNHKVTDAIGVCAYCGRALCPDCIQSSSSQRLVCSSNCADGLAHDSQAIQTILQQTVRSAKASAFYCYLCAGLSAGAAVVAWFMLPSPFLILFTAGCAIALLVSGIWYGRAVKKRTI